MVVRQRYRGADPVNAMATAALKATSLHTKFTGPWGRNIVIAIPMVFLLVVFMLPFLVVFKISLSEMDTVFFKDVFALRDDVIVLTIKFGNYISLTQDSLYFNAYLSSIKIAGITALICLVIAYPFAYFMARSPADRRPALLMLVMLPFWTSFLLRVYAWKMLLADNGVFNNAAIALGLIAEPIKMMNTPFSLVLGMVYTYVPFMILPLYANLVKMDLRLLEAALDLGATPWQAFWRITVPLSKSGIIAGSMLVFIPCIGEFVIPDLLGGPETLMIGHVLWDEFFSNNDWPMAASVAVVMVGLIIIPLALFNKYQAESTSGERA
jgi:putrescine transport system permease protein